MTRFQAAAIEIRPRGTNREPPATLGEHGAKLWRDVLAEWTIDNVADLSILEQACQAYDRAERMRLLIADQGEMIETVAGSMKPNGCIALELQARALCARLIGKLHLSDEPKRGPGRPPNVGGRW
jgi:phage terminase small subunit